MTKRFVLTIALFIAALLLFKKEERFQESFAQLTLPIKSAYQNLVNQLESNYDRHIQQAETIDELKGENLLLRKYLYQQKMTIDQIEQYGRFKYKKFENSDNILRLQTISYKKLNDFSSLYLTDSDQVVEDKIYGLIQKNVAAGIAIKKDGILEGVLLSNEKCQFSTFIGQQKMPGIAKGIDETTMEINFIPKWSQISVGDKVVTSGLDNIFLADIPVGTVTKILTRSTYKTAIITTYADILHPNYFYLVKKVPVTIYNNPQPQSNENNETNQSVVKPQH